MLKYKLMAAVATFAFVATGVGALAQENPKREERPAAERAEPKPPAAAPKAAQMERKDEMKGEAPKASEAPMKREAPRAAEAPMKREAPKAAEAPTKREAPKSAEGERTEAPKATQAERKEMKGGAKEAPRAAEMRDEKKEDMKPASADAGRKTDGRAETRGPVHAAGKVKISTEHATRVSETLRRDVHPVRVDFDVRVGARVPERVEIRPLPEEVIAIVPEYRGYNYFVDSDDEIVFVSPETHEIVGTIDYEGRAVAEDTHVRGARPCPIEN